MYSHEHLLLLEVSVIVSTLIFQFIYAIIVIVLTSASHIDKRNLLPPLLVIQTLAHNSTATLAVVKVYVLRFLLLLLL